MDELFSALRRMVRHPIRANAVTIRVVFETELGAALVYLVRHPVRSLRETFGPLLWRP